MHGMLKKRMKRDEEISLKLNRAFASTLVKCHLKGLHVIGLERKGSTYID